jgi:hypothetical protein
MDALPRLLFSPRENLRHFFKSSPLVFIFVATLFGGVSAEAGPKVGTWECNEYPTNVVACNGSDGNVNGYAGYANGYAGPFCGAGNLCQGSGVCVVTTGQNDVPVSSDGSEYDHQHITWGDVYACDPIYPYEYQYQYQYQYETPVSQPVGQCGGSPNTCTVGSPVNYDGPNCSGKNNATWTCSAPGGDAQCSASGSAPYCYQYQYQYEYQYQYQYQYQTPYPTPAVPGQCGGSDNTCAVGTPINYSGPNCSGKNNSSWTCSAGGGDASCTGSGSPPYCYQYQYQYQYQTPYPAPYAYETPYSYQYQYQTPYSYQYQYQYEYQYQYQTPYATPYSYQYQYQTPYSYQYEYQTPYGYQYQYQYEYQYQYQTPVVGYTYQTPYSYQYQYQYQYEYQYQTPYVTPYAYQYQYQTPYATPYSYQYQYQTPVVGYTYQTPYNYEYEYQTPYAYQYQYQYEYQYQTPVVGYTYQTPYSYQTPSSYSYQTPASVSCSKLDASPSTINIGSSVILTWVCTASCTEVANADGFSTSGQAGGSDSATPSATGIANYAMICGGQTFNFPPVTVVAPNVKITGNPTKVTSGGSSTISWTSNSVTSCAVTKNGAAWKTGASGSYVEGNITTTNIYTITCHTAGADVTDTVTVAVPPVFNEF